MISRGTLTVRQRLRRLGFRLINLPDALLKGCLGVFKQTQMLRQAAFAHFPARRLEKFLRDFTRGRQHVRVQINIHKIVIQITLATLGIGRQIQRIILGRGAINRFRAGRGILFGCSSDAVATARLSIHSAITACSCTVKIRNMGPQN